MAGWEIWIYKGKADVKDKHINYSLDCRTKNCYNRCPEPKTENCLKIDYSTEIKLTPSQILLISKVNSAIKKTFEQKINNNFTVNWLVGFVKNFFRNKTMVCIASCLGTVEKTRDIIKISGAKGMKTALVACKLGSLTIDAVNKNGHSYKHPGCNPVVQAKIFNKLNIPVVVLISLCIGYDMIFIKHCKSYIIPLVTKVPAGYGLI